MYTAPLWAVFSHNGRDCPAGDFGLGMAGLGEGETSAMVDFGRPAHKKSKAAAHPAPAGPCRTTHLAGTASLDRAGLKLG